ncbi:hypothetical protein Tco_0245869 [Tanacetum coccineum]
MVAPVLDVEEDIAMLFGDENDSSDDDLDNDEEVWEMDDEWLMAPVTPTLVLGVPPPSTYEVGGPSTAAAKGYSFALLPPGVIVPLPVIEDLYTCIGNLEYRHGELVKKMVKVSDTEVADSITIGEIGPIVYTVEGQVQVLASQMIQVVDRLEQVGTQVEQDQQAMTQRDETIAGLSQQVQTLQEAVQHRDMQIQQLQTLVSEMSSRESTLMQCILRLDRRLVEVERRPPGP